MDSRKQWRCFSTRRGGWGPVVGPKMNRKSVTGSIIQYSRWIVFFRNVFRLGHHFDSFRRSCFQRWSPDAVGSWLVIEPTITTKVRRGRERNRLLKLTKMCTCFFWILLQLGRANREMCCLWDKWSMAYLILSDSMFAILVLDQSANQFPSWWQARGSAPPSSFTFFDLSSLDPPLPPWLHDPTIQVQPDSTIRASLDMSICESERKKKTWGRDEENIKKGSRSGNFRISVRFITTKLLLCLTLNLDVTCPSLENIVENLEMDDTDVAPK